MFVSRQIVFYTTTFLAIGAYLLVMALGGYDRAIWRRLGRVGADRVLCRRVAVARALVTSAAMRRRLGCSSANISTATNTTTASSGCASSRRCRSPEEDVQRDRVRAMAQIFASPGGILFLRDEDGQISVPAAGRQAISPSRDASRCSMPARRAGGVPARARNGSSTCASSAATPDVYGNIAMPAWCWPIRLRIVSPLLQLDRCGLCVLFDPAAAVRADVRGSRSAEDVGRHVATHLAQHDADRRLAESRQFEAYNRLTAFMMHDLKNSAAQLKLIVANAERTSTIRNSSTTRSARSPMLGAHDPLIEQLRGANVVEPDAARAVSASWRARRVTAASDARRRRHRSSARRIGRADADDWRWSSSTSSAMRRTRPASRVES